MCLEGGEARVTELVGARQVGREVRVWCAQVGVEGCNDRVVGIAGEVEGARAVGVGFEGLDAVVDYGVGVEMLEVVSLMLVYRISKYAVAEVSTEAFRTASAK